MTKFYVAAHALIRKQNRFLVTRRSKVNDYMPLRWDVPGGTVEPGESIYEALRREVQEESGLEISIKGIIYIYTNRDQLPQRQTFQVIFITDYVCGAVTLHATEHDQHKWVRFRDLKRLKKIAFLEGFSQEITESAVKRLFG